MTSVALSFSVLSTETSYDLVNVYTGGSADADRLVASYSGFFLPFSVRIDSPSVLLEFRTSEWNPSWTTAVGPLYKYVAPLCSRLRPQRNVPSPNGASPAEPPPSWL